MEVFFKYSEYLWKIYELLYIDITTILFRYHTSNIGQLSKKTGHLIIKDFHICIDGHGFLNPITMVLKILPKSQNLQPKSLKPLAPPPFPPNFQKDYMIK
jgi:hypothetical protein